MLPYVFGILGGAAALAAIHTYFIEKGRSGSRSSNSPDAQKVKQLPEGDGPPQPGSLWSAQLWESAVKGARKIKK